VAVNWWTSWPAREEDGTVLTERAVLRLQAGGPLSGEIAPASLYPALQGRWPELSKRADELADRVLSPERDREGRPELEGLPAPPAALTGSVAEALREAAHVDAQQLVLFREVLTHQVDLATVYLPGLDILGTKLRALGGNQASTTLLVESGEAVRRYYEWLLDQIAASTADAGPEAGRPGAVQEGPVVVLVGHPGRSGTQAPVVLSTWSLLLPAAVPSTTRGTLYDVAPAILQTLGIPLSSELPGQPSWLGINSRHAPPGEGGPAAEATPPAKVSTYGRRGVEPLRATGAQALDEEMRERLRSLGYVR
jgi:hypothetical protein